MYAIVKTGGKQYRVERGQRLLVERLAAAEGSDVMLEPMLYRSQETVFDRDGLADVKVTAKVIAHVRGEKLRVFKFKPKRGYKRRTGHRQQLTQIEVTEIATGKSPKAKVSSKPATPAPAETALAESAAAPPVGAGAGSRKRPPASPKTSPAKPSAPKRSAAKASAAKASPGKASAAKASPAKASRAKATKAKPKEADGGS